LRLLVERIDDVADLSQLTAAASLVEA
jgi:hypothetical protein